MAKKPEQNVEQVNTEEISSPRLEELYINPKENHYREPGKSYAWVTEMNIPIREMEGYEIAKDRDGKEITWGKQGEGNFQVCMCKDADKVQEDYRMRIRMGMRRVEPLEDPVMVSEN